MKLFTKASDAHRWVGRTFWAQCSSSDGIDDYKFRKQIFILCYNPHIAPFWSLSDSQPRHRKLVYTHPRTGPSTTLKTNIIRNHVWMSCSWQNSHQSKDLTLLSVFFLHLHAYLGILQHPSSVPEGHLQLAHNCATIILAAGWLVLNGAQCCRIPGLKVAGHSLLKSL